MLKLATNSKQLYKAYSVIIAAILFIASLATTVDPELMKVIFSNEKAYSIAVTILSAAVIASRYIKQFDLDSILNPEKDSDTEAK